MKRHKQKTLRIETSIAENNREKDLSQDEKTQTKTLRNKTSFAENNNQEID